MRDATYTEFSQALHRSFSERMPTNATIELTRRCPLTCAHCYNNLPMSDATARTDEMTLDEVRAILDQMADMGVLWLLFTGGEILARRDFMDIFLYARSKGFVISLFTNGTLVTEQIADTLAQHRPFSIEITVYGRTKETYEALTGVPGSFEKCMRGIELLRARNLPLKLKTVAVTINKHEVLSLKKWAEEEMGVPFMYDGMINPRIDCSQAPLATRLTPEELVYLDLRQPERTAEYRRLAAISPRKPARGENEPLYTCGGGATSFSVDPYGRMSLCILSEAEKFDLRGGTLEQGWVEFLGAVRQKRTTRPGKCVGCPIKSMCGMCAANGELENGDPEAPIDFFCRTAHLRAGVFDVEVPDHGNCEYCNGGSEQSRVLAAARRLKEGAVAEIGELGESAFLTTASDSAAPACGTGGCPGCSSSFRVE